MTVIAISVVKDEADIIATTVRNMVEQVDRVIVADNLSTDGTRDILADLAHEFGVEVHDDREVAHLQGEKMTALAHRAGEQGAAWVVPFDADEMWVSARGPVGPALRGVLTNFMAVAAPIYDHLATGLDKAEADEPNPVLRMQWRRRAPCRLVKVAARYRHDLVIAQGNHSVMYGPQPAAGLGGLLSIHHYPVRTPAQLIRKVRNGAAAHVAAGDRLPPDSGAHWRDWGKLLEAHGPEMIERVFTEWKFHPNPRQPMQAPCEVFPPLLFDPCPVPWAR